MKIHGYQKYKGMPGNITAYKRSIKVCLHDLKGFSLFLKLVCWWPFCISTSKFIWIGFLQATNFQTRPGCAFLLFFKDKVFALFDLQNLESPQILESPRNLGCDIRSLGSAAKYWMWLEGREWHPELWGWPPKVFDVTTHPKRTARDLTPLWAGDVMMFCLEMILSETISVIST